jgi:hypothetical protein
MAFKMELDEFDVTFYDELEDCLEHPQSQERLNENVDFETMFRNLLLASPATHSCKLTTIELLLMSSCVFENIAVVENTQKTLEQMQLVLRSLRKARVH